MTDTRRQMPGEVSGAPAGVMEQTDDNTDAHRLFVIQVLRWVDSYERKLFGRLVDRQTMDILRFLAEQHLQRRDVFVQDIVAFTGGYYISASKKLALFEERNLLTREKDTVDGRRTRIVITEKFAAMLRTYLDTLHRVGQMYRDIDMGGEPALTQGGPLPNIDDAVRRFALIRDQSEKA